MFWSGTKNILVVGIETPNEIRFGVNYFSTHNHYDPWYLSDDELERDFALFQNQGLEYVTFCAIWKYLEPELGV